MITVEKADELLANHGLKLSVKTLPLKNLEGQVLAENITATREQPPFNRVAMDGIAVNYKHLNKNSFILAGLQKAGQETLTLKDEDQALEVMTGASLPLNTDTVIPYENCTIKEGVASLNDIQSVKEKQNIHFQGSDYQKGDILLHAGKRLNSPDVAIIASQGMKEVACLEYPEIAIVSTGDELVEPGEECKPWQIWRSNSYGIQSELQALGVPQEKIHLFHLKDDREEIFQNLSEILERHQLILISGGVSMGKFDFVHTIMADLKVETIFHKITQKPGKPLLFAKGPKNQSIFGLPGNPVSALVGTRRYVIPHLELALGKQPKSFKVKLAEGVAFKKNFTLFKAVQLVHSPEGVLMAIPLSSNGSGDFSHLAHSSGFIELEADQAIHPQDSLKTFFPWGNRAY